MRAGRPRRHGVELGEPVPRPPFRSSCARFDAVVNTTRGQTSGGALDKVVYESAACAVPVFACNPYFDEFLGGLPVELHFGSEDDADLARVLAAFAASDARSGRRPAASCAAASRPATRSTAGRTRSSRRCARLHD